MSPKPSVLTCASPPASTLAHRVSPLPEPPPLAPTPTTTPQCDWPPRSTAAVAAAGAAEAGADPDDDAAVVLTTEVDSRGLGLDERPGGVRAPGRTRQQQHCEDGDQEEPADKQAVLHAEAPDNRKLPELVRTHAFRLSMLWGHPRREHPP